MKKRIQGFAVGIICGILICTIAFATPVTQLIEVVFDDYKIKINGVEKTDPTSDMKPFNYNGRTYVPLRFIAEKMNMTVNWDEASKTVYIDDSDMTDYILKPKTEMSEGELNASAQIIELRMQSAKLTNYTISIYEGNIIISADINTVKKEDIQNCIVRGYLNIKDSENNLILDKSHIQKAIARNEDLNESGIKQHFVEVILTQEGRQKMKATSREVVAKKDEGKNYVAIYIDDIIYSMPYITEEIDAERMILQGNFTQNTANAIATVLSTVELPFAFEIE